MAVLIIGIYIALVSTSVSTKDLPELKSGDLVFQTMKTSQSLGIMMASNTLYTHVGIIEIDNKGKPFVVEAAGPVKETPLEEWIKQGVAGRITIKRVKDISYSDAQEALRQANLYLGMPYDIYFVFEGNEIYCSELVYNAFRDGAGIMLGKIEMIQELNIKNFAVENLIKERWRQNPTCIIKQANVFEDCYKIIMEQEVITPASIAEDEKLELIYTNYLFYE